MKKEKLVGACVFVVLVAMAATAQTTFGGTGTWSGSWVLNGSGLSSGTEAQLPQNWVNTHEGDPANGVFDETVYLGMSANGCPANGGTCDYVGAAGLQASMDDWAAQTVDKSRHVIVAHGSDFQGTGLENGQNSGVLLLKTKVVGGVPTNKFIVYESDTPLTADKVACSHGMQDNLSGAADVGLRNNRCDGTCVGGYRTGTGGACVGGSVNSAYNDVAKMWTITATSGNGSAVARGPLVSGYGANHIVLRDLEARHAAGAQAPPVTGQSTVNIDLDSGETSINNLVSHFYIDRSYVHEDVPDAGPTASTNATPHAIKFNCNYCGITNTYVDQVLRPGAEGHVINVTVSGGPMKINHNWLEGASSALFIGGSDPQIPGMVTLTDLEARRNRFTYPVSWLGLSGYAGNGMVKKNGYEIKECKRCLFDGNITENVDGTGGQKGPLMVANVRSCSGGACDNYEAEISDLTVTNGIFRHGCQGGQGDGRSGVSGSGNTVSEGGQRWKFDNNLWYDIQRTQTGCFETGMNAGNNIGVKFTSSGSTWTGCTATRQANGLDAAVDCSASPQATLGNMHHNARVGDLGQITACADSTFNTGTTTQIGKPLIAPTDPMTLVAYYRPPTAPGSASTTGCTFTQYQGFPRDVTITHTTVITNYNGADLAHPFASGSQASKPIFTQRFTLKNNVGIGNGWGTSGTGGTEGTTTEINQFDPSTLVAHHNVWPTRLNTRYTDYQVAGAAGVSPPTLSYFPVSNHCTGAPDANCLGMVGNSGVASFDHNLADWRRYRLCQANDPDPNCSGVASSFAGKADDGRDPGFAVAELEAAQTATMYSGCAGDCGPVGPYDDNSTGVPAPYAELYPDLAFGNQVVGTTSAGQVAELENSGGATLNISAISITGVNAADFSKTTTCGSTLAPGANCTITVRFTPSALGTRSATLAVSDDAPLSPQTVDLNGTGVNSAPAVTLTPGSLSFGSQVIGTSSASQAVTLRNTGGSSLTVSSIGLSGANANNFSQSNNCPGTLAAGASCVINVTFVPLSPTGSKSASISVTDSASGSPHTASLTGTAITGSGAVTIYPATTTIKVSTKVAFSCDVVGGGTCTYTLVSGPSGSSINTSGVFSAGATSGAFRVRATSGSNSADATGTVTGSVPSFAGDCATGYTKRGVATPNVCTMSHQETVGTAPRTWHVLIPPNYVAGQSGLVVHLGGGGHGIVDHANQGACGYPGSETGGWAPYLQSVPAPAPVLACLEGYYQSGTSSQELWNAWNRVYSRFWQNNVTPDDSDFARQVILGTVRDLNLNPKAVMVTTDWVADPSQTSMMAEQIAIENWDLVAVLGQWEDPFFNNVSASRTVNIGPHAGTSSPNPSGPVSVISLVGYQSATKPSSYSGMCGNNTASTTTSNHILTTDYHHDYWAAANGTTAESYGDPSGSNTKFCVSPATYNNGIGNPTTLEKRVSSGGKLRTVVATYRLKGLAAATPICSFDWNGNDTLGCGTLGAPAAIDLRNTTCNWQTPCNHFVDSTTGYDAKGLMYKFFLSHPKP